MAKTMVQKQKREWKIPSMPGFPKPPLEAQIMETLKQILETLEPGIYWRRMEGGGKLMAVGGKSFVGKSEMSGTPDLLIIDSHGRTFWAEVKRMGLGTLSYDQARFISSVNLRGNTPERKISMAAVVCSVEGLLSFLTCRQPQCVIADEFMVPVYF